MKAKINPMHKASIARYKFMLSPRCGARTRASTPCLSPAVHGKKRCRMHGGAKGSGAPKNNQNAVTHGYTTRKFIEERRQVKAMMRDCYKFIAECNLLIPDE